MPSPVHSTRSDSAAFVAALPAAVVCDLSPLAVLAIDGPDAAAFLNGQLSSDVTRIDDKRWQYTSYNSPAGRVLATMVLWRAGASTGDGFRALIAADIAESIRKRLSMFVLRSKVKVSDASATIARYGVGGIDADKTVQALFGATPVLHDIVRSGSAATLGLPGGRYLVVDEAESSAVSAKLVREARTADFDTWRLLTLRAGIPVITAATQDKFIPQTLNWDVLGGIDFRKGCYTGQEIIARTQYLGRLKERLYAFAASARAVAAGERLFSREFDDQACGTVVNSAPAENGGCELLAVVQIAATGSDIHVGAIDGPVLEPLPLPYEIPPPAAPGRSR